MNGATSVYCPRDLDHGPHATGARFCATCGKPLCDDAKPASIIGSWEKWPEDVRDLLRAWNRNAKCLSFRREWYWGCAPPVFVCTGCGEKCVGHVHGTATLKGEVLCDDCLIARARIELKTKIPA